MSDLKLVVRYSLRLLRRQWRRFVLPFLSLSVTAVVLLLILLLTGSSAALLNNQARELQGGDVVLESPEPLNAEDFFAEVGLVPTQVSEEISFSATLQSGDNTAAFSVRAVDDVYPLYGTVGLAEGTFARVLPGEVYLDASGAERLMVGVGDEILFGTTSLRVAGVITSEPTSLFGGFRFMPTALMSRESFLAAALDTELFQAEYVVAAKTETLTTALTTRMRAVARELSGVRLEIAGLNQRGLQFGLQTVSDFLIIAVLITAVLAAVNVYASTSYLVQVEKKSLAVLVALGLKKPTLIAMLGAALGYVVGLAGGLGAGLGYLLFNWLQAFVGVQYNIALPTTAGWFYVGITIALIALVAGLSFIPAVQKSLSVQPRQLLSGEGGEESEPRFVRSLFFITITTLLPLLALAAYLLKSLVQAAMVLGAIVGTYVLIAAAYHGLVHLAYRRRAHYPFILRSIISQKNADGLFGTISFASLFIALVALSTLTLIQVSITQFLVRDVGATVPTTYVLDVQPSQKDELKKNFPEVELFSNIRARIIAIDDLRIQDELEAGNPAIDRELRREFNVTARSELLASEVVTSGEWGSGRKGEISVDEGFAKEANITLGSQIEFSIQGFPVVGIVTSLRESDTRSGLPFFYIVLSPEDIGSFPGVYFGYAYYDEERRATLGQYIATTMPNVSVIETETIGALIIALVKTLLTVIIVVTLPPLLVATLLIAMLVVASYAKRRREGARLRALGLSRRRGFLLYLLETLSVTVFASLLAYALGALATYIITIYYLKLPTATLFSVQLFSALGLVIFFITGIALYLYLTDRVALRDLLSYE